MTESGLEKFAKFVFYLIFGLILSVVGITVVFFIVLNVLVNYWPFAVVFILVALGSIGQDNDQTSQEKTNQASTFEPEIDQKLTTINYGSRSSDGSTYRTSYSTSYRIDEDEAYENSIREDDPNREERLTEYQVEREYEREAWEETWTYDPD